MSVIKPQEINLDFTQNTYKDIVVKQNDVDSRTVIVTCTNNGVSIPINSDNNLCYIQMLTPDNRPIYNSTTILSDGRIQIDFDEQMALASGKATATLQIIDRISREIIHTMNLNVIIVNNAYPDDIIIATPEFSALTDVLLDVADLVHDIDIIEANEEIRQLNEESRIALYEEMVIANENIPTATMNAIDLAYANSNAYTDYKIADLINGAPTTLDTLKEIADAMEENEDVVDALEESIGNKANQAELDTHTGNDIIHVTTSEKNTWNNKVNASVFGLQMTSGTILSNCINSGENIKTMFVVTGSYEPSDYPSDLKGKEAYIIYVGDSMSIRQKVFAIQYEGTEVYERSIFNGEYTGNWAYNEHNSLSLLDRNGQGTRVKVVDSDLKIYNVVNDIGNDSGNSNVEIHETETWSAINHNHNQLKSASGNIFTVQDDNNLVLYNNSGTPIWASNSPLNWGCVQNVESGMVEINPTAVNTITTKSVSFQRTFAIAPNVMVTPQTSVPNTCFVSVSDVTTEGFNIHLYLTDSTTNTQVYWFAIV